MTLNIHPKGYRILVKQDAVEDTYGEAGIVVVEDKRIARAATNRGTVVALGNQAYKGFKDNEDPWAKVGDRIVFAQHAGRTVTDPVTDEEFLIMNDEDVVAVITENEG